METLEQEVESLNQPKQKPGVKRWEAVPAKGKRTGIRTAHDDSIHGSRVEDERAAVEVHETEDEPWVNPASLPYIAPRKGMVQRWIRVALRGEADPTNTARKFREGWKPRAVDTVPHNTPVPRIHSGTYAGCIGVEGMILCEMPVERNAARQKYFDAKNQRQTDAIDQRLSEEARHSHPGFGQVKSQRSTKVVREVPLSGEE